MRVVSVLNFKGGAGRSATIIGSGGDSEAENILDKGEPSMSDFTMAGRSPVQKSRSRQQRDKLTVYLEPDLNDWIRQQVIIEKRRRGHHVEISDIVNEALQKMKDNK